MHRRFGLVVVARLNADDRFFVLPEIRKYCVMQRSTLRNKNVFHRARRICGRWVNDMPVVELFFVCFFLRKNVSQTVVQHRINPSTPPGAVSEQRGHLITNVKRCSRSGHNHANSLPVLHVLTAPYSLSDRW